MFGNVLFIYRRLNTAELEVTVLKDSSINLGRMYSHIKGCGMVETSAHFLPSKATASQVPLLPHIKLIGKKDLSSPSTPVKPYIKGKNLSIW